MSEAGQLIILSGPSGSGKSTVLKRLLQCCDLPLELSVSATTRPPREGEVDGRDYHFVTNAEFAQMRERGEFLECMQVFGRDWYGTLSHQVDHALQAGTWIILEIDVKGAMDVMQKRGDTTSFFVHSGSREELERRLRNRGTDNEASIQRRLEVADQELAAIHRYDYEIINRNLEDAVAQICNVLKRMQGKLNHA